MSLTVDPVGLYAQSTGKVTTEANGRLGKSDFLAMLVAQMKYQDPLNPMDNTEMIAQMAQFSQLEQSLQMSEAFTGMQSISMVGKVVSATATDGSLITGRVTGVSTGQDPVLTLEDGSLVALKDVQRVTDANTYSTIDSISMLGRRVRFAAADGTIVSHQVASVSTGANPVLTLEDGSKIGMWDILEVSI
ncbi:MAG: flagellar hook capping FlgD N-terminal domain-containing protein [Candidatus Coatesbacteria bacterium]